MRQVVLAILVACAAGCGGGSDHVSVANQPPADMAEVGADQAGAATHVAKVSFHMTGVQ
jgi:hypothetical protein